MRSLGTIQTMIEGLSNVRISSESFSLVFPPGCSGNPPTETTICAGKTSVGELFRIFRHSYPLRSLLARLSGRVDPKFPVCSVHFSDSGIDAGYGLESVAPQFVEPGSVVHLAWPVQSGSFFRQNLCGRG
jgi:hypothetical protein